MTPYVSPDHFRTQATGIDLTGLSDAEIRNVLGRASAAVNDLVAAPTGYDFRGGSVVGERHPYKLATGPFMEAQRRVFLFASPILSVEQLVIAVANQQTVTFPLDDLYVSRRWVDIVSLTMTVNGLGAAVLPIIGLTQPEILCDYTYGYRFQATDDPAYSDEDNLVFRATNQWWLVDDDHPVVVKVDGAVVPSGYTVQANEGTVTFSGAQTGDVTISYWHKLPSDIMYATTEIAAEDFGDRETRARGMSGLVKLQVGEISMERSRPQGPTSNAENLSQASPKIQRLLNGYSFRWAGA